MVVLRFSGKNAVSRHAFDDLYIERLRNKDPETEEHFCAYFRQLMLLKIRASGLAAFLEDIQQDTFYRVLRTLRSPGGLRDPGALGAFVSAVCTNVILETRRFRMRDDGASADEATEVPDSAASDGEAGLITRERQMAVRQVIETLAPRDRDLLNAVFLEEQDRDHVCRRFGVTRDYLRVLVHRAKNEFKARYQSESPRPASGSKTARIACAAGESTGR